MENNIEQVPELIFDWLQEHSFTALTEAQQKEVLRHFKKEEYDELHSITQLVKSKPVEIANVSRKELLMQQFDKKHSYSRPTLSLWDQRVTLWKVAAVLFVCGMVWMQYYLFQQKKPATVHLAVADTVYITKEADTVRIYDTVYNERTLTARKSSVRKYTETPASEESNYNEQMASPSLNVISIQEIDAEPNKRKGNSIKDDSLVKNYPFVTL